MRAAHPQLPEGDECPVILCKTREALSLSCLGFGKGVASGEDVLVDLPHITLTDPNTSGDAVVAWCAALHACYCCLPPMQVSAMLP